MKIKKVLALVLTTSVALMGCTATGQGPGNKQVWGSAIGAVAGALLGSQVGGGSGRTLAAVVGGIAGGVLGNVIGANLDERDRATLARSTNEVLVSGEQTSWQSEKGDANATITPVSSTKVTHKTQVARSAKIASYDNLNIINQTWKADKSANLRAAPSVDAAKVGGLQPGQTFNALGRTDNQWVAVSRKGVTIGYVYEPLVSAVVSDSQNVTADLDTFTAARASESGFDLDAFEPQEPVVETVQVQTTCRVLDYEYESSNGNDSQRIEACQDLDGSWQLG